MPIAPSSTRSRTVAARAVVLGASLAVGLAGCGDVGSAAGGDVADLGAIDRMIQEATDAQEDEERRDTEELVAECMADQGFEYVPVVDAPTRGDAAASDGTDPTWGALEFAEQWGYGIITNPSDDPGGEGPAVDAPEDPNQPALEAMSASEREAYLEALWGPATSGATDSAGEYLLPSWEEQGCRGYAHHEVHGDAGTGPPEDNAFLELWDALVRVDEATRDDERVRAAEADWAACMADAGRPDVTRVGDAERTFREQVDLVWAEGYADVRVDPTDEDVRAAERAIRQRLAELRPEEIELAVTDVTCRTEVGYDEAYREVNMVLQQEFVDTHRAELEAWTAELASR